MLENKAIRHMVYTAILLVGGIIAISLKGLYTDILCGAILIALSVAAIIIRTRIKKHGKEAPDTSIATTKRNCEGQHGNRTDKKD